MLPVLVHAAGQQPSRAAMGAPHATSTLRSHGGREMRGTFVMVGRPAQLRHRLWAARSLTRSHSAAAPYRPHRPRCSSAPRHHMTAVVRTRYGTAAAYRRLANLCTHRPQRQLQLRYSTPHAVTIHRAAVYNHPWYPHARSVPLALICSSLCHCVVSQSVCPRHVDVDVVRLVRLQPVRLVARRVW